VWTGSYRALFTRVVYTEWIFFGLMAVGLLLLRHRSRDPDGAPPLVASWAWPWVPIVFAACAFGIAVNQIVEAPANSLAGMGLVLLGIPVYAVVRWRASRAAHGDAI